MNGKLAVPHAILFHGIIIKSHCEAPHYLLLTNTLTLHQYDYTTQLCPEHHAATSALWEVQHNTPLHAPPHIKPLRYQVTRDPVLLHLHEVAVSGGGGGTGGRRREGTRSGWRGRCQAKKGSIPEERDEFCVNRRMDTKERWMWGKRKKGKWEDKDINKRERKNMNIYRKWDADISLWRVKIRGIDEV